MHYKSFKKLVAKKRLSWLIPGSVQKQTCEFLQEGWLQAYKQGSVRSTYLRILSLIKAREGRLGSIFTTVRTRTDAALGIFLFLFQARETLGHSSSLRIEIIHPSQPFLFIF